MWEDTRQMDISDTRPDTWQEWERGYQNAIDRYYGSLQESMRRTTERDLRMRNHLTN